MVGYPVVRYLNIGDGALSAELATTLYALDHPIGPRDGSGGLELLEEAEEDETPPPPLPGQILHLAHHDTVYIVEHMYL